MSEQQSADDWLKETHHVDDAHIAGLTARMDQATAWARRVAIVARETSRASIASDWPMVEHMAVHLRVLLAEVGITDPEPSTAVAAVLSILGRELIKNERES